MKKTRHQKKSSHRAYAAKAIICAALLALFASAVLLGPRSTAFTSAAQSTLVTTTGKRLRPEYVPGEILVRFKRDRGFEGRAVVEAPSREPILDQAPREQLPIDIERFDGSNLIEGLRIAHVATDKTLTAVDALNARDDVLYAEPDYLVHADVTPNDPRYVSNELYALNLIGAPQAWDVTTGSRNVVVAVIDEGIDIAHPDLQANIWTNPSPGSISGITGDINGYNFKDNNGTIPAELHATHVAGTIGGVGNNSIGVAGINWQVSIMSLRFISAATGNGTNADALRAYNYAKQMRDLWISSGGTKGANIRVINASYGGGGYSQADADAINALGQSGILFVAAAGNSTADTDVHPFYPAGYSLPNVISVAATNSSDALASFSNFGSHSILMGAPGVVILSTTPSNNYGTLSGTSMATPHVAGAGALLCAANSNLSVNQLRALLAFNGDSVAALQAKTISGRRLNIFKSFQAIGENDVTAPGAPTAFQITSQDGRTANLSWTASGDDGPSGQASLYDLSFIDQTSGAVTPLTSIAPVAAGTSQSLTVNIPYRHVAGTIRIREFDNVGNEGSPVTVPVTIPLAVADPYTTQLNSPTALSTGGTPLSLTFDDRYLENFSLPFTFPFFNQAYTAVTISTNGNLYFSTPVKRSNGDADDVPSSIADLANSKMIAGMWDDLDLRTSRRADADVYVVQPGGGRIIFRWQGVQFGDGTNGDQVNFEIELRSDGTVITRYGSGNTNLLPVVGISNGAPDPYTIDSLTSELTPKSLTNAQSAVFTPRLTCSYSISPTSQNFSFNGGNGSVNLTTPNGCGWTAASNADWIDIGSNTSGTGNATVNFTVAANNGASSRTGTITIAGQTFTVNQAVGPTVIQFGAPNYLVGESAFVYQAVAAVYRNGPSSGVSSVDFATSDTAGLQACNVINGIASARCDYLGTSGSITFAPGETYKTISVSIINDSYQEGNENFTISLKNPTGASLNSQSSVTITILDTDGPNLPNPLSVNDFFVRQHYLDFLNRETDSAGFFFWVSDISSCGSDQQCIEVHRINVSAAFFFSIEFQQTGYLVERIYKTAFGDAIGSSALNGMHTLPVPNVRFNQFLNDAQQLDLGVIVNQGNWQQQLEVNKQAFFAGFVQRPEFTMAFPADMSPAAFVDKLNLNAQDVNGNKPLSPGERDQLVSDLLTGTKNRAQALRVVAEHPNLAASEFRRAFVLMQYFGYLRRNPNEGPDGDYTGYDFWLTKLNQFNGNFIGAELVKGFLNSDEYRKRFGQ